MTPSEELIYNYCKQYPGRTRAQVVAFTGGDWRNTYRRIQIMLLGGKLVRRMQVLYAVREKK